MKPMINAVINLAVVMLVVASVTTVTPSIAHANSPSACADTPSNIVADLAQNTTECVARVDSGVYVITPPFSSPAVLALPPHIDSLITKLLYALIALLSVLTVRQAVSQEIRLILKLGYVYAKETIKVHVRRKRGKT